MIERHALARLHPGSMLDLAGVPPQHARAVRAWFARGWLAVGRRRAPGDPPHHVCLGIALPPGPDKVRISLSAPSEVVAEILPPLTLDAVIASAPRDWQAPLERLDASARRIGITVSVYGSFAWQRLTGERYVRPASDIDLLWRAVSSAMLTDGLRLLVEWQAETTLQADGEVLLPDGAAVAWRELIRQQRRVLVKHAGGVALREQESLITC